MAGPEETLAFGATSWLCQAVFNTTAGKTCRVHLRCLQESRVSAVRGSTASGGCLCQSHGVGGVERVSTRCRRISDVRVFGHRQTQQSVVANVTHWFLLPCGLPPNALECP